MVVGSPAIMLPRASAADGRTDGHDFPLLLCRCAAAFPNATTAPSVRSVAEAFRPGGSMKRSVEVAIVTQKLLRCAAQINAYYPRPSGMPRSVGEKAVLARARQLEERLKVLKTTKATITVATGPEYWGSGATTEQAVAAAERMAQDIRSRWPEVEVRLVPERVSNSNKSTGDEELVQVVEAWVEGHFHQFMQEV